MAVILGLGFRPFGVWGGFGFGVQGLGFCCVILLASDLDRFTATR